MEDAGSNLSSNGVLGPAQQSTEIQLRHGGVCDDRQFWFGGVFANRNVDRICRVVKSPLKAFGFWVGIYFASDLGIFLLGDAVRGNLTRGADGRILKRKINKNLINYREEY